jgi:hypothetical protein
LVVPISPRDQKAFDTPSGLPYASIQLNTGKCKNGWQGQNTNIAEAGTLIIEFRYLSMVTGNPIYGEKAENAMNKILDLKPETGLFNPVIRNINENIRPKTSPSFAKYSFGALNDSFYEYMVSGMSQRNNDRDMYISSRLNYLYIHHSYHPS